jgi:hypothetical protein
MNSDSHQALNNAGVIAHSPLIYVGALIAGLLVDLVFPVPFLPITVTWVLGLPLICVGVIIGLLGDRALDAAGTNRSPYSSTTKLVTRGRTTSPAIRSTFLLLWYTLGSPYSPTRSGPPYCSRSSSS